MQNHKIKRDLFRYRLENISTGEIREGYRTKKYTTKFGWKFLKMNIKNLTPFKSKIDNYYYLLLLEYLEWNTNRLVKIGEKGIRESLKRFDIERIMQSSRTTVYRFLQNAGIKNIIRYDKGSKSFFVNPEFALNGDEVPNGVFTMFDEGRQKSFKEMEEVKR